MPENEQTTNELDNLGVDELLAATQGDDVQTIDSQRKDDKPPADTPPADTPPDTPPDTNKGGEFKGTSLSQEDYDTVSNELSESIRGFNAENSSDDDKAIRADMLALFEGATGFDEDFNLVDAEGKQIASYEELVDKVGNEEEADFDDDGNQIDKEGKIITSKHQLDVNDSNTNTVGKELGYEFDDGKGGIKLYKEGNEGLKELTEDIANYKLQDFQNEFFNSNPVLREVAKHLLGGGQLEDFQKPIDYIGFDVKDMTLENKKAIVKQSYLADGVSETRANKLVESLEEGDALNTDVQESLEILQGKQEARETARQETLNAQVQQQAEDNTKYWGSVEDTITKGTLDGLNLPEADRKEFFNYLALPVKDGQSQDMIDRGERNLEQELKEAFYRFKGYDVSSIVKEEVSRKNLLSTRQRIKKSNEMNQSHKPHIKGGAGEISIDNMY